MNTVFRAFLTRHSATAYFALTFAISWGGVLLIIGGPGGMRGAMAQDDPRFPFVFVAMLAGPSLASILLIGVVGGKAGLRALLSRLVQWRVGLRWYAVALLATPLLVTTVLLALSGLSPEFLPGILKQHDKATVLLLGLAVGPLAGFFEELGWTGFAIPRLRQRYSILATGLIVGALWSAWHFLVIVWGIGGRSGSAPLALFVILDGVTILPAFRVLMVFVYDRTESLIVAMLMHASLRHHAHPCAGDKWGRAVGVRPRHRRGAVDGRRAQSGTNFRLVHRVRREHPHLELVLTADPSNEQIVRPGMPAQSRRHVTRANFSPCEKL